MTDLWWAAEGDGTPLLLLHSGLSDSRSWELVLPSLARLHRVIRYDARGFGRSPDPVSEFDAIGDALAVMDVAGVESAHLVGNSMGALVARAIAVLEPSRVRSLTLVGASFPVDHAPEEARAPFEQWRAARDAGDIEAAVTVARTHWMGTGAQEGRLRELLGRQRNDLPDSAPLPEVAAEVERITTPTLVIVGEADAPLVILGSRALANRIPGTHVRVIAGARHHPQEDQPEEFARLLIDFLAAVDAPREHAPGPPHG